MHGSSAASRPWPASSPAGPPRGASATTCPSAPSSTPWRLATATAPNGWSWRWPCRCTRRAGRRPCGDGSTGSRPADRPVRRSELAVLGAWLSALAGRPAAAERWADAAERGPSGDPSPDGGTRSTAGGPCSGRPCAATGRSGCGPTPRPPWRSCRRPAGGGRRLSSCSASRTCWPGTSTPPIRALADAAELGEHAGADTATVALAERSLVAISRGAWPEAETLAERARSTSRGVWLEHHLTSVLLHAVSARLAIHRGEIPSAREHLARAERLRPQLSHVLPHYAVQAQLELVRGHRALTDTAAAREVLWDADDVLRRRPDLGVLGQQADKLRTELGHPAWPRHRGLVADGRRDTALPAAGQPLLVPGDRRPPRPVPAHREVAGDVDLPEARRLLAKPGDPARPGPWPARGIAPRREGTSPGRGLLGPALPAG